MQQQIDSYEKRVEQMERAIGMIWGKCWEEEGATHIHTKIKSKATEVTL